MLDFNEIHKTYTKEKAESEANRCLSCVKPKCKNEGCPANLPINEYIKLCKEGKIDEAYEFIMRYSNLSPICSRVCDHKKQCVGSCILNIKNNPICIGNLERYIYENRTKNIKKASTFLNKKVAIIGSGPAGLSCGLELIKNGIPVTIYEKESHFGGLLTYGIPSYRLPIDVVEDYITFLRSMGIQFVANANVTIENLKKEFDAIFVACGLSENKKMHIEGEDSIGVLQAINFLKDVNSYTKYAEGNPITLTGKTLIVGAGNVAIDCARCAARLGNNQVEIVYRRSENEAPASKDEIKEAKQEGVAFHFLRNPVRVLKDKENKVIGVECEIMELGEVDSTNRKTFKGTKTYEIYECDRLIMAIGQNPNIEFTNSLDLLTDHGYIVTKNDVITNNEIVLAGGDIVRGASSVVLAMVDGKKAGQLLLHKLGDDKHDKTIF